MNKGKKIAKLLITTFRIIMFVLLAAFILVVCLQRFSNNKISFFNYRMFTVVSQSMAPKYDIGDVLISKQVKPEEIKENDVISYLGTYGDFTDKVITHRVVGIHRNEDGKYYFRTKGDANIVEDPIVEAEQVYGVVTYRSILLSLIYRVIGTKVGFYLCIIIPIMFIIGSEMVATLLDKEEERRAKLKEQKKEKQEKVEEKEEPKQNKTKKQSKK